MNNEVALTIMALFMIATIVLFGLMLGLIMIVNRRVSNLFELVRIKGEIRDHLASEIRELVDVARQAAEQAQGDGAP